MILYHGTSSKLWPNIKVSGLQPSEDKSVWLNDPDAREYQNQFGTLRPHNGVYFSEDVNTAYYSALLSTDLHGGNPLILIAFYSPVSRSHAIMDEDDLVTPLQHAKYPNKISGREDSIVDAWISDWVGLDRINLNTIPELRVAARNLLVAEYKYRKGLQGDSDAGQLESLEDSYEEAVESVLRTIGGNHRPSGNLRFDHGIGFSGNPRIHTVFEVVVNSDADAYSLLLVGSDSLAQHAMNKLLKDGRWFGSFSGIRKMEDEKMRHRAARSYRPNAVLFDAAKSVGRVISQWSTADGSVALVRTKDGAAYEIEIRPAKYSQFEPFREHYTEKKKGSVFPSRKRTPQPLEPETETDVDIILEALMRDFDTFHDVAGMTSEALALGNWEARQARGILADMLSEYVPVVVGDNGYGISEYVALAGRIIEYLTRNLN